MIALFFRATSLTGRVYNEMHESVKIMPVTSRERVMPCISLYTHTQTRTMFALLT